MGYRQFSILGFIALISAIMILGGCGPDTESTDTGATVALADLTKEQKILLINELPLGITYQEAKARLLGLSDLLNEGGYASLGDQGLKEAAAPVHFDGYDGELELNFKNDTLYSYTMQLDSLDQDDAVDLYKTIGSRLDEELGAHREESIEEGAYKVRSSFWQKSDFEASITHANTAGAHRLAWGYQTSRPAQ